MLTSPTNGRDILKMLMKDKDQIDKTEDEFEESESIDLFCDALVLIIQDLSIKDTAYE